MVTITDYTNGKRKVYGPFTTISFCCMTQSFPAVHETRVTYSVTTPDDTHETVTVSLVHIIETERKA